MKYSIIIPSYNSEATIIPCLQSVTQQQFDEAYEVIVVDSSADATPEIIRQDFPQVTLIHSEKRMDPGTARNTGIKQAQGEIICFIDSDCIANPDWLHRMIEAHNDAYAAVGGSIANGNPESLIGWAGYFAEFREFFPFHPEQFMSNIPTCNISYKRWVFEKYGNFPDLMPDRIKIKHPQQEDLILNLNLYTHGEKILFDPEIRIAHINMTSVKRFMLHQYRLGRNTSYLLKHFNLHGSFIVRSRILTVLTAPFLPYVKFLNTFRVAMVSRKYVRYFLSVSPVLLIGLLVWGIGFLRGAFLPKNLPSNSLNLTFYF